MNWTIRRVLFTAFALVVVLVAGSLALPMHLQQARVEEQLAAHIVASMGREVGERLDGLIGPLDVRLRVDLEHVRAGLLPRDDPDALRARLLPPMRHLRGVESMMVGDETGYQWLLMRWNDDVAASPLLAGVAAVPADVPPGAHYFTREFRLAEWGSRSHWTLWDEPGQRALARWDVDLPDYDPRQRPWQTAALARRRAVEGTAADDDGAAIAWTGVYSLFTTKRPGISASAATRCPDGSLTIVAYDLLLDDLCSFTSRLLPTAHGLAFLCTDDGRALALPGDAAEATRERPDPRLLQPLATAGTAPLAAWHAQWQARARQTTPFRFQAEADDWWGAWQPFALGDTPIWLGVVVPRRDVLDLIGYTPGNLLLVALPGLVGALLLASWLSWRIARPLHEVAALSERIGALELTERPAPTSRIAEHQKLVDALVAMRASLREHVDARERAVRDLSASEERFRTTFELAPVGIAHVDPDGRFRILNDHFCELLGRSRDDLLQSRVLDVTWDEDRDADWARLQAFFADPARPDTTSWSKRWCHRDGHAVTTQASVRLLRDGDGAIRHVVLAVSDLTERLALEAQLQQAQRLEAIGRLAGGVAHDFNNLLTGILGHVAMAVERIDRPDTVRSELRAAEELAGNASTLVRQLLTYSRQHTPQVRTIDAERIVLDTGRLLRRLLRENVALSVRTPGAPQPTRVDPARLQQVVINLALNAQDAMPRGGSLAVSLARAPEASPGMLRLCVVDDGVGMNDTERRRAFDPFFTTKPPGKGTGLGLATCREIVMEAGGTIAIDSRPGAGTTVTIELPLAGDTLPAPTEAPAAATQPRLDGHETILFVEDEAAIRGIVGRALVGRGYDVLMAEDGERAIELADSRPRLDLLLTDVVLPGMHGADLARRLRERHRGLRVLFLSGYTPETISPHLGDEALLQKPFTPSQLLQRVREVLDRTTP